MGCAHIRSNIAPGDVEPDQRDHPVRDVEHATAVLLRALGIQPHRPGVRLDRHRPVDAQRSWSSNTVFIGVSAHGAIKLVHPGVQRDRPNADSLEGCYELVDSADPAWWQCWC